MGKPDRAYVGHAMALPGHCVLSRPYDGCPHSLVGGPLQPPGTLFPNATPIGHTCVRQKFPPYPNRPFFHKKEAQKIYSMTPRRPRRGVLRHGKVTARQDCLYAVRLLQLDNV